MGKRVIFRASSAGQSDVRGTRVTLANAPDLLVNASTCENWQKVLEKICDLVDQKGTSVLPEIDHGRVHFFIQFWAKVPQLPLWMSNVCKRLDMETWQESDALCGGSCILL